MPDRTSDPHLAHRDERHHRPDGLPPAPASARSCRSATRAASRSRTARACRWSRSSSGRNADKVRELAELHGVEHWTTDADAVISDPTVDIYFDAQVTSRRYAALTAAMKAGKHIFTEKPTAETLAEAIDLAPPAREHGRHGGRGARQALPAGPGQAAPPGGRGLLRPDPVAARRVRLLGVRGRRPGGPAPQLELPQGGRRRHRRRHVLPLELRAGGHPRHGQDGERADRHAHPDALGRAGQARTTPPPTTPRTASSRSRRPAATRRRADQLVVGRARVPRRAGRVPGRRHARLGGRGAEQVRRPAARAHPEARVEPGPAASRVVPRPVARGARQRRPGQRLQAAVGGVPARRRRRAHPPLRLLSAARGVQLAELGLQSSAEGRRVVLR